MGRVVLHTYYAVLWSNLSEDSANLIHPLVVSDTLLNISKSQLPPMTELFLENQLPADIYVREHRLLLYLPYPIHYFPVDKRPEVQAHFDLAGQV